MRAFFKKCLLPVLFILSYLVTTHIVTSGRALLEFNSWRHGSRTKDKN